MMKSLILLVLAFLAAAAGAQSIQEQVDEILEDSRVAGNDWSILVENESGTVELYSRTPDNYLAPASNTKLFTSAAAFGLLGVDYVFETPIYIDGTLDSGVLNGDLILLPEHDPTWNSATLGDYRDAFDYIANRLESLGINQINGSVRCYGAGLTNYGTTSILTNLNNQPAWNEEVASELRSALIRTGVSVSGGATGHSGFTPPAGSTLFHTHRSNELDYFGSPLTLDVICIPLNKRSSNPMSELVLRHLGWELGAGDSFDAGETITVNWLRDVVGLGGTDQIVMNDGSGLSWNNRFTARQTLELTRWMVENYPTWGPTLPIGCVDGTIGSRFCGTVGAGNVHAKTGTLSISIALSGWIDNPNDGQRYYFSFITNRSSIDQSGSRAVIDEAVIVFGGEELSAGPLLQSVIAGPGGNIVTWTPGTGIERYEIYSVNLVEQSGMQLATIFPVGDYIIETRDGGLNVDDYEEFGEFQNSSAHSEAAGLTPGIGSRFALPGPGDDSNGRNDRARFTPDLPNGEYEVFVTCFNFLSANAQNITVRFSGADGEDTTTIDLTSNTAGDSWLSLGTMAISEGAGHYVEFDNSTQSNTGDITDSRMNPAAVRFSPASSTLSWTDSEGGRKNYEVVGRLPDDTIFATDIYGASPGSTPNQILIVDGNDRWLTQPENPAVLNHAFAGLIGDALGGESFDTVANEAVESGAVSLADYEAVFYILGEESSADESFSDAEQALVSSYLAQGGRILVSGAEHGYDLVDVGSTADTAFYRNDLRFDYAADQAGTDFVSASADDLFAGVSALNFENGPLQINFADVLSPINGSVTTLQYDNGAGAAGLRYQGVDYRTIGFGFPLENIAEEAERMSLVQPSAEFLLRPFPVSGLSVMGNTVSWTPSASGDVIEYEVGIADSEAGPFMSVGTTEGTAFELDSPSVAVQVIARDRWGDESTPAIVQISAAESDGFVVY